MNMKINLNATIRIRLNAEGKRILREKRIRFPPEKKNGAVIETELWHIMNIFGSELYHGCEIPFEGNEIAVLDSIKPHLN